MKGRNVSPFCYKLELYLKLAKIPYEIVKGNHYSSSPKNKLPYVQINDQVYDDSSLIIQHLQAKFIDIDAGLNAAQKAQTHLLKSLIEERLYLSVFNPPTPPPFFLFFWTIVFTYSTYCSYLVFSRWVHGWSQWKKLMFSRLGFPLSA